MFSKSFQRKYALTDQGVKNTKKGAFWTVIVNLVVMGGMGILYLLMYGLMGTLTDGAPLPGPALFLGLVIAFVILSFVTHLQQYHASAWPSACGSCPWATSASGIWRISPRLSWAM